MNAHVKNNTSLYRLVLTLIFLAFAVVQAQIVVWALGMYHIHSGLLAPWLLIASAEFIIEYGVQLGVLNAAGDCSGS
jgi:hypothetical protein